jgi:hypothetical protein
VDDNAWGYTLTARSTIGSRYHQHVARRTDRYTGLSYLMTAALRQFVWIEMRQRCVKKIRRVSSCLIWLHAQECQCTAQARQGIGEVDFLCAFRFGEFSPMHVEYQWQMQVPWRR